MYASRIYNLPSRYYVLGRSEVGLRGCEGHEFTSRLVVVCTVETDGMHAIWNGWLAS
jgi:hypothetical protein